MISFESTTPRGTPKLDASVVVWLTHRLGTDEQLAEAFKLGTEKYPFSFAAYIFGTDAAKMEPENLLRTFTQAHVGNFLTEAQAFQAVLGRIGWQHEVSKIGDQNDEEPVTDFLSWKTEMLRERFADQYAFIPLPGTTAVFDLDIINAAIYEE